MTIPANNIVTINPGVISAGGNPLALNGLILSKSLLIPTNTVQSFPSATAVRNFFGPASDEYAASLTYFQGFDGSTIKPGTLHFAPYVDTDRAAWLQSGSFANYSLAQLQAITAGTLIVTVDGVAFTSSSINLSAASSFSNAATLITAAFTGAGKPTATWDSINSTFALTSATAGATSVITFATGTISTGLKFTSATGAILSQGDVADTPATAMDNAKSRTQNWATFTTMWEPVIGAKEAFSDWVQTQNQRWCYVAWDTDAQAIVNGSTSNFGAVIKGLQTDGVVVVYNTLALAVLELGTVASLDFSATEGDSTIAFRSQAGFTPTVTDEQIANNLLANGYSFYGSYSTSNDTFNCIQNGQMAGKWQWMDVYINQIQLNNALQLALMTLMMSVKSIPYNERGYTQIRTAMTAPINNALNFGSIRRGVELTASQASQVNQQAGVKVDTTIAQQGYYLQIKTPGADVKAVRGSPIINLWYTDGGAVQKINVASIAIL